MVYALQTGVLYGPIQSRRFGRSLGINLSPCASKLCSFNCVYCQYGPTERLTAEVTEHLGELPAAGHVLEAVASALRSQEELESVLLSGNGEPTLHPDFPEMVERVNGIRQRLGPGPRTAVLSNSARVTDPAMRDALARLDVRIMKLDCGTEEMFRRYNRPGPGLALAAIVDGLRELAGTAPVTIQALFAGGAAGNLDEAEGRAWIDRLVTISPAAVQLYTLARGTPSDKLVAAPGSDLRRLAEAARARGVPVTVFG